MDEPVRTCGASALTRAPGTRLLAPFVMFIVVVACGRQRETGTASTPAAPAVGPAQVSMPVAPAPPAAGSPSTFDVRTQDAAVDATTRVPDGASASGPLGDEICGLFGQGGLGTVGTGVGGKQPSEIGLGNIGTLGRMRTLTRCS